MTLAKQYLEECREIVPDGRMIDNPEVREFLYYVSKERYMSGHNARLFIFADESKLVINGVTEVIVMGESRG